MGAGREIAYFLRSKSVQRAGFAGSTEAPENVAGGVERDNTLDPARVELMTTAGTTDYDECLACQ